MCLEIPYAVLEWFIPSLTLGYLSRISCCINLKTLNPSADGFEVLSSTRTIFTSCSKFCGTQPLREHYLFIIFLSSHSLIVLYNELQMPVKPLTVSACDPRLFVIQNFIAILVLSLQALFSGFVSSANSFTFIHISCARSLIYKMNKKWA